MKSAVLTSILSTVAVILLYFAVQLFTPVSFPGYEAEVKIPRGTSFRQAVRMLSDVSCRRDLTVLYFTGLLTGDYKRIKAGYYLLKTGMYPLEILDKFVRGDTIKIKIPIIPGHSLSEIAEKFAATETLGVQDFMKLSVDKKLLNALKIDAPSLEGYLYPDTYVLEKGVLPEEAITKMVNALRRHYPPDFSEMAGKLGMNENQVLTLASIIEKEAKADKERPIISAVYHNRLKRNMPLQADPTSIYGVKPFRFGVTHDDLSNDTPYNTYKITGLPPGPIASPSLKSIAAALDPSDDPYLYFVSRKDGTHQFSVEYTQHREAIDRYYKKPEAPRPEATRHVSGKNVKTHKVAAASRGTYAPAKKTRHLKRKLR